jgi:hypothetical protein
MKIHSGCLNRFLSTEIGKAIGEKLVKKLTEEVNKTNAYSAELTLRFMDVKELENSESDNAEILVKIAIEKIVIEETDN